ncbi:cytochrome c oxidase subunit 3 [Burkholderia sp. BCC1972]|uniref:cytochrome c oxidase subunit 3 n=1 Tax=Burkholderia sp. BCC1972 TaxID=2817438 RepID=UPI002ABD1F98|nr:cytochrome c oxidase subunit 3 [Burkholderia sp. BCC1972]
MIKAGVSSIPEEHLDIPESSGNNATRIPGEPGVWLLIFGDLCVFAVFFLHFVSARSHAPDEFAAAHTLLDRPIGLLGSLLLLTSSLFVALGVHRLRRQSSARRQFSVAIAFGAAFVVCKLVEYGTKIHRGITPATDDFFMYYFAFTGIHLAHVLLGLGILLLMRKVSQPPASTQHLLLIESGGLFWHLVDLLWIVLFALFYVLGG